MSKPKSSPEETIARQVARRFGGARSPTNGSISCGVTVVNAVINDNPTKTENEFVRHNPSHYLFNLSTIFLDV